jgi:hypothetical protein
MGVPLKWQSSGGKRKNCGNVSREGCEDNEGKRKIVCKESLSANFANRRKLLVGRASSRAGRKGVEHRIFKSGDKSPHSKTLRDYRAVPNVRQVLDCGAFSAAFS